MPRALALSFLGPDSRLLLACARGAPDDDVRSLVAEVENARAWEAFVRIALFERAERQVAERLAKLPLSDSASRELAVLRREHVLAIMRQQRLYARLFGALDVLEDAGIVALPLKGAALGLSAYRAFGDRPMNDLDLLVPPADAARAHALLQEQGWTAAPGSEHAEEFYRGHSHLAPLTDETGVRLEVHVDILRRGHPFAFDGSAMLAEARQVTVRDPRGGTRPVVLPSALHLFAHGCLHFAWAHVMRTGLVRWAADLRALSADPTLDWGAVVRLMRVARAGTTAFWALRVVEAAGLWDAPPEVMRALAPRGLQALEGRLARHFLTRLFVAESALLPVRVDQLLWSLALRPGASGHGRERPWTRDVVSRQGQQAGAPATPLRFPEPALPGVVRGRLAARYLWRLARAPERAERAPGERGMASRAR